MDMLFIRPVCNDFDAGKSITWALLMGQVGNGFARIKIIMYGAVKITRPFIVNISYLKCKIWRVVCSD